MKKVLAMLLAIVMTLSIGSVVALAEGESKFVIDGVKDAGYSDKKMITHDYWSFYDGSATLEPVDPERVKNTVWFDWDDNYIYIYYQAECKYDLADAEASKGERPSDLKAEFHELISVYLDTAPSAEYKTLCSQGLTNEDGTVAECNHFCCTSNNGEMKNYRMMARVAPAWNHWYNYYRSHEGIFMTYEEFLDRRLNPSSAAYDASYVGKEQEKYAESNGGKGIELVSFFDAEKKVYGVEMKYHRSEGEEFFQFNITTDAPEFEWEVEGPELAYGISFCANAYQNAEGLLEIYYEDYLDVDTIDPAVAALTRKLSELPGLDLLNREHKNAVVELYNEYNALSDDLKAQLVNGEGDYLAAAYAIMEKFAYIDALGDVNGDNAKNASDALMMLKASVNKIQLDEAQLLRAEVTGDGTVNAKDALEVLQVAVKKRTEFSIERTLA